MGITLFYAIPSTLRTTLLKDLRDQLNNLKALQNSGTVDAALRRLRELLARYASLFDPHTTFAVLESLVDVARDNAAANTYRYSILRQIRPMLNSTSLQPVLIKLVGSEEEIAIAKEIQKAMKSSSTNFNRTGSPYQSPGPHNVTCFLSGQKGHMMRQCYRRARRGRDRGRRT
ncbi:hypothetical protein AC249_AIPGENE10552 [Exaiptasia diaphana]|nr:hypothetical protein AC249_AIPGENE10552 [Exaiptasia diaphana]